MGRIPSTAGRRPHRGCRWDGPARQTGDVKDDAVKGFGDAEASPDLDTGEQDAQQRGGEDVVSMELSAVGEGGAVGRSHRRSFLSIMLYHTYAVVFISQGTAGGGTFVYQR